MCMRCKKNKNFSEFRPNKINKSGYSSYCYPCAKEYAKEYNEKNSILKYPKEKIRGNEKHCTICNEYKPISDFKQKRSSWCNVCQKEYDRKRNEKALAKPRKYLDGLIHCRTCDTYLPESSFVKTFTDCAKCKNENQHKKTVKKHGITYERYLEIYNLQDGKCKICNNEEDTLKTRLSIDHDHSCCPGENSCGKCVRGLLCHRCNTGLGNFRDDLDFLKNAIAYLQSS